MNVSGVVHLCSIYYLSKQHRKLGLWVFTRNRTLDHKEQARQDTHALEHPSHSITSFVSMETILQCYLSDQESLGSEVYRGNL